MSNMVSLITAIIAPISQDALPIVVCVLGCVFIYFKIGKDRKHTKTERDIEKDELDKKITTTYPFAQITTMSDFAVYGVTNDLLLVKNMYNVNQWIIPDSGEYQSAKPGMYLMLSDGTKNWVI